ncbi:unnamed protein product [Somion occarium]|uniref:Uncharacterized protein n=1 Tax=Somion occarium TaxID=3059160 RepID=A0ABP1CRV6_9APHY
MDEIFPFAHSLAFLNIYFALNCYRKLMRPLTLGTTQAYYMILKYCGEVVQAEQNLSLLGDKESRFSELDKMERSWLCVRAGNIVGHSSVKL